MSTDFAALVAHYVASFEAKANELERLSKTLRANPQDAEAWRALFVAVHRLGGSAGAYGFDELGARAIALEPALRSYATTGAAEAEATYLAVLDEVIQLSRHLTTLGQSVGRDHR